MQVQIIAFYEFTDLTGRDLLELKSQVAALLRTFEVRGTIILANEGYNGMVCGETKNVEPFVHELGAVLGTKINFKSSFHDEAPLRKIDVKIKPEIVTLKRDVDLTLGRGTHVDANRWNEIISDPETLVIDTRNDYEYETGTFKHAVNPKTTKFSELPDYFEANIDPAVHRKVAVFCTGGIRCEKFVPYLKAKGFQDVYQLEGGILRYLETVPAEESRWEGECSVFDERISLNAELKKGTAKDLSLRHPEHVEQDPSE